MEDLKKKTVSAVLWNSVQRYGVLVISFASNIILARLLLPDDFGIIGFINIFIAISTAFIDTGFNAALIQKKHVTNIDWSTVFYWNITIAIILYIILFFTSDFITIYFKIPVEENIIRILSLILIINSLCSVQSAKLTKSLSFKPLALRSIFGSIAGSIVGIILAINGFGVWSLIWQSITNSIICTILLWKIANWRPIFVFSFKSLKSLFRFGGYVFVSGMFDSVYTNFQSFVIGKFFSIKDLGYFSQAKRLERVPVDGTSSVLGQVLFPVYSSISEDRLRFKRIVRKNITAITYLTFPLMSLLIVIADPLIQFLYGEKWIDSIPMFQILCIFGLMSPLNRANSQIFRALGNGKIFFTLQFTKQIFALLLMLIFIPFGMFPFLWACAGIGISSYIINLYYTDKVFQYSYIEQLKDILPNLLITIIVSLLIYKVMEYTCNWDNIFRIIFGAIIYIITYICSSIFLKLKGYALIIDIIKVRLHR